MNQGRIWCVVSPSVGLPLLLGSVAVTSLIVHASIMTHTTWMSSYWMGSKARVAMQTTAPSQAAAAPKTGSAFTMMVTPVPATATSQASFVITVNPAAVTTPNVDPAVGPAAVGDAPPQPPPADVLHAASAN